MKFSAPNPGKETDEKRKSNCIWEFSGTSAITAETSKSSPKILNALPTGFSDLKRRSAAVWVKTAVYLKSYGGKQPIFGLTTLKIIGFPLISLQSQSNFSGGHCSVLETAHLGPEVSAVHGPPPQVFVLAASNLPWDLDSALLRRLEKRIHVPLPDTDAREQMFRKNLADVVNPAAINFRQLALKTQTYSGADIIHLPSDQKEDPLIGFHTCPVGSTLAE